ncbi:uncharacterized protein [Arachis hypogaea]|uniref:uncharacterized protein n=1 Tax=Arachis hypogaea TaxID=3818 RepID=UPI000DECFC76|nr:uncharacterized protein LOC112805809 [Arachis hypogaea]
MSQDHRQLDSSLICRVILPLIQSNPSVSIPVLQGAVQALQSCFPDTICDLRVKLYYEGHLMVRDCCMFDKVFWAFLSCVEAFKHCKPFVFVDSTHLYSKYGGVLLIAVAKDGNSNILPISFAIVESESTESWSFFLTNLRRHVTPQDGLLVISDRSQAIKAALAFDDSGWHPPRAFHDYCIRHMTVNFMSRFKLAEGKRYLINAAYSPSQAGFEWYMDVLRGVSLAMADWAGHFRKEIWLQHCDSGRRFSHMTTNLSECINAVLKGTRYLPISAVIRITYERLQKLFVTKGREAQSQLVAGNRFSQRLLVAIEKNRKGIPKMHVTHCDRWASVFVVEELEPFEVAGCTAASIEWVPYVNPIYRQEAVFKVYEMEFPPIPNESLWSEWHGTMMCPNLTMRQKATRRPVSTRFRNDMDDVEHQEKRCALCRQVGHTRRGCPNQPTGDA